MAGAFQQSAFQFTAFQMDAVTGGGLPPAGGVNFGAQKGAARKRKGKVKRWVLGDRVVEGTREQLESALEQMLTNGSQADHETAPLVVSASIPAHERELAARLPAYPDLKAMLQAAGQIEAAQALRAVAKRMADLEDEREIEMLLMSDQ